MAVGIAILGAALPAARADRIVVGSSLSEPGSLKASCAHACTLVQRSIAAPALTLTSPVDGRVVAWRLVGGSPSFAYKLRLLRQEGLTGYYEGVGTSAPAVPLRLFGIEEFPTGIPVKAGDAIGIDLAPGAPITYASTAAAPNLVFEPPIREGLLATRGVEASESRELYFDAIVQPKPFLGEVFPAAGPLEGGNEVAIFGQDLAPGTAVAFGGIAARVDFEGPGRVNVAVPAGLGPGPVPVTVTTVAGTTKAPAPYVYQPRDGAPPGTNPPPQSGPDDHARCLVPRLTGFTLRTVRRRLAEAGCGLGAVRRRGGEGSAGARIVSQHPAPGTALAGGGRVAVVLGLANR